MTHRTHHAPRHATSASHFNMATRTPLSCTQTNSHTAVARATTNSYATQLSRHSSHDTVVYSNMATRTPTSFHTAVVYSNMAVRTPPSFHATDSHGNLTTRTPLSNILHDSTHATQISRQPRHAHNTQLSRHWRTV